MPKILGVLYDAVAAGLKSEAEGPIPAGTVLPRMAASGAWAYRCLPAIGMSYESWQDAINAGQDAADTEIVQSSEVGKALLDWWEKEAHHKEVYKDTAAEWRNRLLTRCPTDRVRYFPGNPARFSASLKEIVPALRKAGIEVEFPTDDKKEKILGKKGRHRLITISAVAGKTDSVEDQPPGTAAPRNHSPSLSDADAEHELLLLGNLVSHS